MSRGVAATKAIRKDNFRNRLAALLAKYPRLITITAEHVGSKQLQTIRKALRGRAEILMGKNTMIRKAMRDYGREDRFSHQFEELLPHIRGHTGLVFTNGDVSDIGAALTAIKVQCAAKTGAISPVDVVIPAGNTNLEPTKTSFFQALSIPSKINRGTIALDNNVNLIKRGEKVTHSQAALLQMLNIKPFQYGLKVGMVYEAGTVCPYSYHDPSFAEETLFDNIVTGIRNVAALSIEIHYPTCLSVMHSMQAGYVNLRAVAVATDCPFSRVPQTAGPPAVDHHDDCYEGEEYALSMFADDEEEDNCLGRDDRAAQEVEDEGMDMGDLFGGDDDEEPAEDEDSLKKKKKDAGSVISG